MKIENKLTLAHLKQNKRRSIITILGIMLAVAMFTVVISAGASLLDLAEKAALVEFGSYHFALNNTSDETLKVLDNNKNVAEYCFEYSVPVKERGYYIENGKNKRTSIGDWNYGDTKYISWKVNNDLEGKLPEKENEIVIGENIIKDNNLNWKIGDIVDIATVYRYYDIFDYGKWRASGAYSYDETDELQYRKSYKIVGIAKNYNQLFSFMENENHKDARTYVKLKKLTPLSILQIYNIFDQLHISRTKYAEKATINTTLLTTHLIFEPTDLTAFGFVGIVAIILVIIMLCAAIMIYNAFSMSYAEKVRYLGMLSSVGATRKQKLKSSYFEALVLGGIGIPLGFLVGVGITEIAILTLGKLVIDSDIIQGVEIFKFRLVVPITAIMLILMLSIITIIIAVYKPAKRASEITPIEAIRSTTEHFARFSRNPWLIKKLFGYEGVLAYKNQKRNGRKGRIITTSIAFSAILILLCSYGTTIAMESSHISDEQPYQVRCYNEVIGGLAGQKEFTDYLDSIDEIDKYYSLNFDQFAQDFKFDGASTYYYLDSINVKTLTKKYKNLVNSNVAYDFYSITDEDFNEFCKNQGIDPEPYYHNTGQQIKCVVINNLNHKTNGKPVFTDELLGKEMYSYWAPDEEKDLSQEECDEWNKLNRHFVFNEFCDYDEDSYICHLSFVNTVTCIYPISSEFEFYKTHMGIDDAPYEVQQMSVQYGIETEHHEEVTNLINEYFDARQQDCSAYDSVKELAIANATITIIKTVVYGFIVLLIAIIMFNIINIISTSTELRRKEFAMLKSVGTTPKGFNKMISLECIFYTLKALIFAYPISVGLSIVLNKVLGDGKIPFQINWLLYFAVLAGAFAVVGISMLLGLKNINNNSIIEDLK